MAALAEALVCRTGLAAGTVLATATDWYDLDATAGDSTLTLERL